jgi:hypothetical protein
MLGDNFALRDPPAPAVLGDSDPGVQLLLDGGGKVLGAARPARRVAGLPGLNWVDCGGLPKPTS